MTFLASRFLKVYTYTALSLEWQTFGEFYLSSVRGKCHFLHQLDLGQFKTILRLTRPSIHSVKSSDV